MSSSTTADDRVPQAYLPDFCAAGTILVILLVGELVAILLTIVSFEPGSFLTELSKISMFVLWLALLGAGEAALAVFDEERAAVLPETPTTFEAGYAMGAAAWSGFYGPAGVPDAVRARLEAAFARAFETEEWTTLCREHGLQPLFLGREEFEAFAGEQARFFGSQIPELVRLAGRAGS